jgi:hypothetical protein
MSRYAIVLSALLLGLASALSYAQAPVPFINLPLVPDATAPRGPQFTLTVNGTGFVSNSVVNWNGTRLATQFVNQGQLTATVPASNIATASTGWVTVVNPAPGGGTSNTAFFSVIANEGNSAAFTLVPLPLPPPLGNNPTSVAVGDFNGDGKLDLAIATSGSQAYCWNEPGAVAILLGDGTGNFSLASAPAVGLCPASVAVGDFNGDGKLDLVVANEYSNTVSILLGDGTGTFILASSPAVGSFPQSVAVGDFNGDGKLDLAVATNPYGNNGVVSILLGDGTGNFTLASSPAVSGSASSAAVGDFNGDGKLDLAVASEIAGSPSTVSILLGDGAGNFALASSLTVEWGATSVAVGDFNRDGKLDLVVANEHSNTASILLGDGTGSLTLASSPAVGGFPESVAVGDFNGDGKLDLAVANYCGGGNCGTVSILLGDGSGNFTLASSPVVSIYPESVAAGDFNGDGKLDVVTANWSTTASILLQDIPAVTLWPTTLTFGTQLVRTASTPQTVTLTNAGSAPLGGIGIVASANFSERNNCGHNLKPGASCTIDVAFRPHRIGTLAGTITITDNASNSPQTISLSGVGTEITLSPSGLNFGDQVVGTTSSPQTVTFTNVGPKAVTILGVGIANAKEFAQTNDCGTSVPAGGACTISVTFTPTGPHSYTGTLEVNDNGGANPQTVALSGTGTQ